MNDTNDDLVGQQPLVKPLPWWQKRIFMMSIALLGLAVIIITLTINVAKYETHLATGDTVLLALAPVDPRGFMQGDYMALSYAIEREILAALENQVKDNLPSPTSLDGYVVVALDEHNVGQFVRLATSNEADTLAANEMAIYYRIRNNAVKLATNAFFFQEGHATAFEAAEYGQFRVNDKGEPLLTDMVDSEFKVINIRNTKVEEIQIDEYP